MKSMCDRIWEKLLDVEAYSSKHLAGLATRLDEVQAEVPAKSPLRESGDVRLELGSLAGRLDVQREQSAATDKRVASLEKLSAAIDERLDALGRAKESLDLAQAEQEAALAAAEVRLEALFDERVHRLVDQLHTDIESSFESSLGRLGDDVKSAREAAINHANSSSELLREQLREEIRSGHRDFQARCDDLSGRCDDAGRDHASYRSHAQEEMSRLRQEVSTSVERLGQLSYEASAAREKQGQLTQDLVSTREECSRATKEVASARRDIEVVTSRQLEAENCARVAADDFARHVQRSAVELAAVREEEVASAESRSAAQRAAADEQARLLQQQFDGQLRQLASELDERLHEANVRAHSENSVAQQRLSQALTALAEAESRAEASERRLTGLRDDVDQRYSSGERWQATADSRHSAAEQSLVDHRRKLADMDEQLRRVAVQCQELPSGFEGRVMDMFTELHARMDQERSAIREELGRSALTAFNGELKLWAKVNQLGSHGSGPAPARYYWEGQATPQPGAPMVPVGAMSWPGLAA